MNAFQIVFDHLRYLADDVVSDEILTNLLDEHAHELAEEIREFAAKRPLRLSDGATFGLDMAADLIDPKMVVGGLK